MANEWSPENVFEILSDERARRILAATNTEEKSVKDLSQICEGSQSSIYRRIDVLSDYDLLEEKNCLDTNGHHYSVYEPAFEDINFTLKDNEVVTEIEYGEEVDTYTENWPYLND